MATRRVRRQARVRRLAGGGERIWYGALSVLAVVVIVSAGIVAAASQQQTCLLCHRTIMESAGAGAHKDVPCDRCHGGTTGFDVLSSPILRGRHGGGLGPAAAGRVGRSGRLQDPVSGAT